MKLRPLLISCLIFTGSIILRELHAQPGPKIFLHEITSQRLWSPDKNAVVKISPGHTLTLLVLLSPECPMCVSYTQLLKKTKTKYGDDLQLIGLVPGRSYKDPVLQEFAESYALNFPIYVDKKFRIVSYLKGEVTPECFLFDKDGRLVYSGAIDNWLADLGKKRPHADQHYLLDAIEQSLSYRPVVLPFVKAQGCLLNEY